MTSPAAPCTSGTMCIITIVRICTYVTTDCDLILGSDDSLCRGCLFVCANAWYHKQLGMFPITCYQLQHSTRWTPHCLLCSECVHLSMLTLIIYYLKLSYSWWFSNSNYCYWCEHNIYTYFNMHWVLLAVLRVVLPALMYVYLQNYTVWQWYMGVCVCVNVDMYNVTAVVAHMLLWQNKFIHQSISNTWSWNAWL